MKISTRGRYALRVMVDLAINESEDFISLKDVAKRQDISMKYLEQIIAVLNKANLVKSARGNSGGYKLVKPVSEYTVGDILRAAEGDLTPTNCITENCIRKNECLTFSFWQGLDDVIEKYVDSKTLKDLMPK